MLFRKKEYQRRRRGAGPLRTMLSLFMLIVLSAGLYSAYKSFSGIDPLKLSPKGTIKSLLSSDTAYNLINGILSFNPKSLTVANNPTHQVYPASSQTPAAPAPRPTPKPVLAFRFAVVADSENDNDDLLKALTQAKSAGAQLVIGLGDWTQVGTVEELSNTKTGFDKAALNYYLIPGDHDLWDSRNRNLSPTYDYNQVFGKDYSSFTFQNSHFLLIDNSDNYHGVGGEQLQFIQNDLETSSGNNPKSTFVFVSTPTYHPSSDHVMGGIEPKLHGQAVFLDNLFKKEKVSEVFGGDTHFYSAYTDPATALHMTAVGAITAYRNLQGPRYALVDVYADGSYNIQDTEVK